MWVLWWRIGSWWLGFVGYFSFGHHLTLICPDKIALSIAIGFLLGFSFHHLMKISQHHKLINRLSYIAQYLSLAMLTVGISSLLGTDDLMATFICGATSSWDNFTEKYVFSRHQWFIQRRSIHIRWCLDAIWRFPYQWWIRNGTWNLEIGCPCCSYLSVKEVTDHDGVVQMDTGIEDMEGSSVFWTFWAYGDYHYLLVHIASGCQRWCQPEQWLVPWWTLN